MANYCMSCGVSVEPTAKFCKSCGQALEQDQSEIPHGICPEVRPIEYPAEQQQQYPPPLQTEAPQYTPQYPPQSLYPQYPYQQPTKKKSMLPLILGIAGGIVIIIIVAIVLIVSTALGTLSEMSKTNFYEIGRDEISSIKLALGEERTVVGLSASTQNGVTAKEITFSVEGSDQNEDMAVYMDYLCEEDDFLLVTDVDFSGPKGKGTLGRNSIDDGYSILVQLEYDDTGYVITLIRQKGAVTVIDTPGSDSGQGIDPEPKPDPVPDPDSSPKPDSDPEPVIAAESALEIFDSGYFHLNTVFATEDGESFEMDTYIDGAKAALFTSTGDMTTKMVIKDGKVYYIVDDLKTVYIDNIDPEELMPEYGSDGMSYIGEGSGEFNDGTYRYSEYSETDGSKSFYFMEGSSLVGIRFISADNSIFEMTVLALDTNVPDDVFLWPSNYEIIDLPG